jgi:hypothetical protein
MYDMATTMGCNFLESKSGRATACQGFSSDSAESLFQSKLARTLARSLVVAFFALFPERTILLLLKQTRESLEFFLALLDVSQSV